MSDPSAALRELGAVAQAHPQDAAAWYRWAVGLARAGQRGAALQAAQHALPLVDQAPLATGLGKLLEILEQHSDAAHAYRRATQLDPAQPDAHLLLGSLLRRLGDPRAAALVLRAAVARLPTSAPLRLELARAQEALGQAPGGEPLSPHRAPSHVPPMPSVPAPPRRAAPRAVTGGITSDLAIFSLPEVLEFLLQQRATGRLVLRDHAGHEGSLELHEGQLAGARHPGGRRLSDLLVDEERVSRADLLRATAGAGDDDAESTLAALVLEHALIGRDALLAVVTRQIGAALTALVPWRDGQATFHREQPRAVARPPLRVDTRWALFEAVRRLDEDARAAAPGGWAPAPSDPDPGDGL